MSKLPKKLSEISTDKAKNKPNNIISSNYGKDKNINVKNEDSASKVISKIEAQKTPGRYNLYIDDQFALGISENVLIQFMLRKGMEVTEELMLALKEEEAFQAAYRRALTYLSYSLRTEKEIRKDLEDKGYGQEIDAVIDKLKDQAYVDDGAYAKAYIQDAQVVNHKGPALIRKELIKKGLDPHLVEDALEEYSYSDQLANAVYLAEKQIKTSNRRSTRETQNKVQTYLMQKGYSRDLVDEVLHQVTIEKTEDEEYAALVRAGDKAWRRYSKFEASERAQKTKAHLYRKGYPFELIEKYIQEKEESIE